MNRPMLTKRCRNWGTKSESLSLVGNIEHGSRLKVHRRASSMEVQLKAAGLTESLEVPLPPTTLPS